MNIFTASNKNCQIAFEKEIKKKIYLHSPFAIEYMVLGKFTNTELI